MKIEVIISKANAVMEGSNEYDLVIKDLDISLLSPEDRETLANKLRSSDRLYGYPYGILDLDNLRRYLEKYRQEHKKEEQERLSRQQAAMAEINEVIANREVTESTHYVGEHFMERSEPYIVHRPSFGDLPSCPGVNMVDVYKRPDYIAWIQELEEQNKDSKAAAEQRVRNREEKEAKEKQAAMLERNEWIEKHGSPRLKSCLAEGFECQAIYKDERLAFERPNWRWVDDVFGEADEPRNPPEHAFILLATARKTAGDAVLKYWVANDVPAGEQDEYGEYIPLSFKGYCAVAKLMGNEIVFGLPGTLVQD